MNAPIETTTPQPGSLHRMVSRLVVAFGGGVETCSKTMKTNSNSFRTLERPKYRAAAMTANKQNDHTNT